jgi:hypothetical protein
MPTGELVTEFVYPGEAVEAYGSVTKHPKRMTRQNKLSHGCTQIDTDKEKTMRSLRLIRLFVRHFSVPNLSVFIIVRQFLCGS